MVNKQRVREIMVMIGLDKQRAFEEAVRNYVRFCYRTWEGPPEEWPQIKASHMTRVEFIGSTRDPIDLELIKTIKAGGKGASRLLQNYMSREPNEEKQRCMEIREPRKNPKIFCTKADWRRLKDRKECMGCRSVRVVHEFGKGGELTSSTLEFVYDEEEISMGFWAFAKSPQST
jgi:hypothetical protein